MLSLIGTAIFGLIVGALAKFLVPGKDPGGLVVTMLLGVAGALVGGWLGRSLGWYAAGDAAGFMVSTIGAILLLAVYRGLKGKAT